MEWVLVLILLSGQSGNGAMTTIPGYEQEDCLKAAEVAKKQNDLAIKAFCLPGAGPYQGP